MKHFAIDYRECKASHYQHGQALVEFLVLSLVLLPLFLIIPLLGKYNDISNAAELASRYAAFDATLNNANLPTGAKTNSDLSVEIKRRFFSNADAPIKSNDAAGNFKAHENKYWRTPTDTPLIADFDSDITINTFNTALATHEGGYLFRTALNLPIPSLIQSNVQVKLAKLPSGLKFYEPFDSFNIFVLRSTFLMNETWAGVDPNQVERRFSGSGVFPARPLSGGPVSSVLGPYIGFNEMGRVSAPKLGAVDFWTDYVPADRTPP